MNCFKFNIGYACNRLELNALLSRDGFSFIRPCYICYFCISFSVISGYINVCFCYGTVFDNTIFVSFRSWEISQCFYCICLIQSDRIIVVAGQCSVGILCLRFAVVIPVCMPVCAAVTVKCCCYDTVPAPSPVNSSLSAAPVIFAGSNFL